MWQIDDLKQVLESAVGSQQQPLKEDSVEEGKKSTVGGWFMGCLSIAAGLSVLSLVGLFIFWLGWVNYVENYQLGYKFDTRTGETTVLDRTGYFVTPPFLVKIHTIDLRPMQVCISSNARVLNCKLVQFNKDGVELFISWHGRNDYEGPGSNNGSNLDDILEAYAYEGTGRSYPFLTVLRELKTADLETASAVPNLLTPPAAAAPVPVAVPQENSVPQ